MTKFFFICCIFLNIFSMEEECHNIKQEKTGQDSELNYAKYVCDSIDNVLTIIKDLYPQQYPQYIQMMGKFLAQTVDEPVLSIFLDKYQNLQNENMSNLLHYSLKNKFDFSYTPTAFIVKSIDKMRSDLFKIFIQHESEVHKHKIFRYLILRPDLIDITFFEILLENGISVNELDENRQTLLDFVTSQKIGTNKSQVEQFLISHGAKQAKDLC
ncbi:hypothetical protein M1446_02825 [Candidatus Dependentiae bacterium]|nr:hypothetical protein [Candidatus Dependentiae bacterium]